MAVKRANSFSISFIDTYNDVHIKVPGSRKFYVDYSKSDVSVEEQSESYSKLVELEARIEALESQRQNKDEESEKFAKIGRKLGEFRAGDIVRGNTTGKLRILTERRPERDESGYGKAWHTDDANTWVGENQIELITPVERRFDRG